MRLSTLPYLGGCENNDLPIPEFDLDEARKLMMEGSGSSANILINITLGTIVSSHRASWILGFQPMNPKQLRELNFSRFYQSQNRRYTKAAVETLFQDGFEHLAHKNIRFEINVPSRIQYTNEYGARLYKLFHRISRPFYLLADGQRYFASIETYQPIGVHWGNFSPLRPSFTRNGIPLEAESGALIRMGNQYIRKDMRKIFTPKEWDILEEMADTPKAKEIAILYGQNLYTIKDHFKNIREKVRINVDPKLRISDFARALYETGLTGGH